MNPIKQDFVLEIDTKLIADDVKLHARPFHVALAWMSEKKISGNIFDAGIWNPLMEVYRCLYPSGDFSMPSLLVGGVALRDYMYPVRIKVSYGAFALDPLTCIDIKREELELIFQHFPDQGWRAFYGVCDLLDFGYSVDDLIKIGTPASDLLNNARSAISATARILFGAVDIDAAIQTTCLTAELSMKAALIHLSWTEDQLKKLGHRLPALAKALIGAKPKCTDDRLRDACTKFPDYVGTRYASHGLTRVQLMGLAMRAQFVAADALRRISDRNMGDDMEARPDCPHRLNP